MKLWLAPLHGITHYYFRNVLFSQVDGIDEVIAPFIPVQPTEKINISKIKELLPNNNSLILPIPQLMGNVPHYFINTIDALQDKGYQQFNWNLGCPASQIVRRNRGCGLMQYPDLVEETVDLVSHHIENAFSLKIRLGMTDIFEGIEIIKRMNQYPLNFIVIHPRLGIQQYNGQADIEGFKTLAQLSKHKIIYNGDIVDQDSFQNIASQLPCIDDFMIGRGLLRNPFLAEEIKNVQHPQDQNERFRAYFQQLASLFSATKPDKSALGCLKELLKYFSIYKNINHIELAKMLRIEKLELFIEAVTAYL
ncbi:MAG: tRNA-dihydrouridine synthase family protein [Bacteroidales bacterium]|jgi:tRNA-dihydrouridine synthase|nr:tRNA-dihydrouridine synthase family protein [Bacteroidales bacterium]